jgi:hypothetical protein
MEMASQLIDRGQSRCRIVAQRPQGAPQGIEIHLWRSHRPLGRVLTMVGRTRRRVRQEIAKIRHASLR